MTLVNDVYYKPILNLIRTDFLQDMLTNFQMSLKYLLSSAFIICLVTSCAVPKTDKSTTKTIIDSQLVDQSEKKLRNAEYYLTQAQSLSVSQSLPVLVTASEHFLLEDKNHQALWLANQASALLAVNFSNQLDNIETIKKAKLFYRLSMVKASSLMALDYSSLAEIQLKQANALQLENKFNHQLSYHQLMKQTSELQNQQLEVLDAQLRIFSLEQGTSDEQYFSFWQSLSQLSSWQVKQLQRKSPPNFSGWQQLLLKANQWSAQTDTFERSLKQWQLKFKSHPANIIVMSLANPFDVNALAINNIAVLLPLTGRQSAAGLVAQQGLLAAYAGNTERKIHFIDENQVDMTQLQSIFTDNNIDFVIGPLLKNHVDGYLNQQSLSVPTLLLNLPETNSLLPHQFALSMRREDEAKQAASSLSQKNYQHPLILSSKSNISRRIAETFAQQWQNLNGQTPEISYFDTGKKMQDDLKTSLGIDNSQRRVKDISRRFKTKVKSELRNRRDTDMIYLVANPQQTKLLKPYIDVNTSPFSSIIPVYASSLSHSVNDDKSDNRDLTGLVFTEIPWLLNSSQQNRPLVQQSQTLWPQRTDSLQRIFAMGYDSLFLVDKLTAMQQASYIRHYGQTGVLKLDEDNILTRSLIWGRYRNNKVKEVVMN